MRSGDLKLEVDPLKLYFGCDYKIGDKISIKQPTIGQLIDYGEKEYYSMLYCITSIPSDAKSMLWDNGIDYCKISDMDYFVMMTRGLTKDQTSILLGDLDLSKMEIFKNDEGSTVLADVENEILIDEFVYMELVTYIRMIHNIKVKYELTNSKMVRDILIQDDRDRRERHKNDPWQSGLLPMISALVTSGCYTKKQLWEVGLYEFYDTVNRLNIINTAKAILNGLYCGFADYSKNRALLDSANIFKS